MLRSWRELRSARHRGKRDGKAGVPTVDQEALPFDLRESLAQAQARVHAALRSWTQADRALEGRSAEVVLQAEAADARLADACARRDGAIAQDELRTADEQERLERLASRLEELAGPEATSAVTEASKVRTPLALVTPIAGGSEREDPDLASADATRKC